MKKILIFSAILCAMTSCLDKEPTDSIPADKAVTSVEEADQAIIGIYSAFLSGSLYSGYLTVLPDLQCDLVYAVNGYSNQYGDIWRGELLATNQSITAVYGQLYGVISQCNFAMEKMDAMRPTIQDDDKLDQLESLYGEARFARALCYSELIRLFCDDYGSDSEADGKLGVVLRTRYSQSETLKRATLRESYEFVMSELDKAAVELKVEDDYEGALYNQTYFDEYTVRALQARLSLYMGRWSDAEKYASLVIGSGYYWLSNAASYNYSSVYNDYEYMWTSDNSTEIIWKVGFTTDAYGGALGQPFLGYNYISYLPDYVPAKWALNLYDSSDLRYSAFFTSLTTGHSHALTWPLLTKYMGNETLLSINVLHTSMPKPFRLSEQYLIRAEAYAMMGNLSKAAKDITTLRQARYSGTAGSPSMSTVDDAMAVIERERVKELFMEGFRLSDLKRWHKGFTREPQTESLKEGSSLTYPADDPRLTWPIPQHELSSPGADILPNPSNK